MVGGSVPWYGLVLCTVVCPCCFFASGVSGKMRNTCRSRTVGVYCDLLWDVPGLCFMVRLRKRFESWDMSFRVTRNFWSVRRTVIYVTLRFLFFAITSDLFQFFIVRVCVSTCGLGPMGTGSCWELSWQGCRPLLPEASALFGLPLGLEPSG